MNQPAEPVPALSNEPQDGVAAGGGESISSDRPAARSQASWLEETGLKRLDPRFIQVERFVGLMVVGGLAIGALVVFMVILLANWPPGWGVGIAALAMIAALLFLAWAAWFWPRLVFRYTRYKASDDGLQIYRGVFWRSIIDVPRNRIQHSDVSQGPLQRRYGLGKLVVHTAGSQVPSIELDGLCREEALAVRELLVGASNAGNSASEPPAVSQGDDRP